MHGDQRGERPEGPVAAVTGATGAIGGAIAEALAARRGYRLVLLGRDEKRTRARADLIRRRTGNPHVTVQRLDQSRRGSVQAMAERWGSPLHLLVNNAAVAPAARTETPDGIELQFATNVLGYLWLTEALSPWLMATGTARVINVASYWAGGLDLEDLEFRRRPYDNDAAYRQSKQANRMLSAALADRLSGTGVTVNSCHPGDVNSQLSRDLGFGGHETPEQASRTPVWLATEAALGGVTGRYFEHMRESRCRFVEDPGAVEALYQACAAYAG